MPSWPNHNIRLLEYTKLANMNVVASKKVAEFAQPVKGESARKREATALLGIGGTTPAFRGLKMLLGPRGTQEAFSRKTHQGDELFPPP